MIHVYGLTAVSAPRRLHGRGAQGETLRLRAVGRLAIVIGIHDQPMPATADRLWRYSDAVERLFAQMPAFLPARFGTHFSNAAELDLVVASRGESLRQALQHVRQRAQMTVRIVAPPAAIEPADGDPRGAPVAKTSRGPRAGAAYLHVRAAAARAQDVPGVQLVRAAVSRWVRDEHLERKVRVVSMYHLIPRSAVVAYRREAARAATAAGLRIIVSGPWAPFAFGGLG